MGRRYYWYSRQTIHFPARPATESPECGVDSRNKFFLKRVWLRPTPPQRLGREDNTSIGTTIMETTRQAIAKELG